MEQSIQILLDFPATLVLETIQPAPQGMYKRHVHMLRPVGLEQLHKFFESTGDFCTAEYLGIHSDDV